MKPLPAPTALPRQLTVLFQLATLLVIHLTTKLTTILPSVRKKLFSLEVEPREQYEVLRC